jgi:predicted metal-dependent HD superfamily phosphohydrolase
MVPPTYAALAHQAATIMERIIRAHHQLLSTDEPQALFDYADSAPLRQLDLSLAQATWAFSEAKRRVRERP